MVQLRFRGGHLDVTIDPARLAGDHPSLARVRKALIDEHGNPELVDQYLTHRLAAAFGKFGYDYIAEMSARIDRIFDLRDRLAGTVDASIRGQTVSIESLRRMFDDLSHEMDGLRSPKEALGTTKLDVPPDLPPGTALPPGPPARRGGPGGPPPSDPLGRIAVTERVREGLQVVDSQTAAPELRRQIADLAQKSGPQAAETLLRQIGNFLKPENAAELKALSQLLARNDARGPLLRLLSATDQFGSARGALDWTADIHAALRLMADFSPEGMRGVGVVFASGRYTAATALRIFHNFKRETGLAGGIFESLARLEKHSGLDKVISFLADNNPEKQKGALGQLLSANQLLDRYPDAMLVFEEPRLGPDGRLRVADIVVWRPGGIPIHVEVKFHTTFRSLGKDARAQLAADLVQDAAYRREFRRSDGSIEPPFAAMRWRFEKVNLRRELAARLGREATDAELAAEIRKNLQAVFKENEAMLRLELGPEFDAYKKAFEDLLFVEFY
jgi:hypothetical protein